MFEPFLTLQEFGAEAERQRLEDAPESQLSSHEVLWMLQVYGHKISDRQAFAIALRFGLIDGRNWYLHDIAPLIPRMRDRHTGKLAFDEDKIGVSKERVRHLIREGVAALKRAARDNTVVAVGNTGVLPILRRMA